MTNSIRSRKTLFVAVFAAITVMALAPVAGAAQLTEGARSGSGGCSVDQRIQAHEPGLCSSQYAGISSEVADEPTDRTTSSVPTYWPLYLLGAVAVAGAATFSALRGRPQAIS